MIIIICHYEIAFICERNILERGRFLREHPHIKVSVLVGLKGGGDDEVFSRRKIDVVAHFSQVDEGLGARRWTVAQEEVFLQVHLLLAIVLGNDTHAVRSHEGALYLTSDLLLFYIVWLEHFHEKWVLPLTSLWIVFIFVYVPPQAARQRQKKIWNVRIEANVKYNHYWQNTRFYCYQASKWACLLVISTIDVGQ